MKHAGRGQDSGGKLVCLNLARAGAGAILYTVALVLYPGYFMFVIVEALLGFIGFIRTP